jgi:uncharacterized protein YigA (DUF484 family)
VVAYLRAHPALLRDDPALLAELFPGTPDRGDGAVDMQHYLIRRQRSEITALQKERDDLVALHRDNLSTQSRIHELVLALIGAASVEELVQIVTGEMAAMLDLDTAVLCVASEEGDGPRATRSGLRLVPETTLEEWLGDRRLRLIAESYGDPAIFGQTAGLVRSQALIRLAAGPTAPNALLAFGARDPHHFTPAQGSDLLTFLGRSLEAAIMARLRARE